MDVADGADLASLLVVIKFFAEDLVVSALIGPRIRGLPAAVDNNAHIAQPGMVTGFKLHRFARGDRKQSAPSFRFGKGKTAGGLFHIDAELSRKLADGRAYPISRVRIKSGDNGDGQYRSPAKELAGALCIQRHGDLIVRGEGGFNFTARGRARRSHRPAVRQRRSSPSPRW